MTTKENLCKSCKYYDCGEHECKAGQYIDTLSADEIVVDCEDYESE